MSEKLRALVDLDGVLCDFDKRLAEVWKEKWPDDPAEMLLNRDVFEIPEMVGFCDDAEEKLKQIYLAEGFYASLEPILRDLGAVALDEMKQNGHDVYILTSAGSKAMKAPTEKFVWVRDNLGSEWVEKIIISKFKHIVDGDILIDDKPSPNGENQGAKWEHVIYDQPFNRHVTDKRRMTWKNWRDVLPELCE